MSLSVTEACICGGFSRTQGMGKAVWRVLAAVWRVNHRRRCTQLQAVERAFVRLVAAFGDLDEHGNRSATLSHFAWTDLPDTCLKESVALFSREVWFRREWADDCAVIRVKLSRGYFGRFQGEPDVRPKDLRGGTHSA